MGTGAGLQGRIRGLLGLARSMRHGHNPGLRPRRARLPRACDVSVDRARARASLGRACARAFAPAGAWVPVPTVAGRLIDQLTRPSHHVTTRKALR